MFLDREKAKKYCELSKEKWDEPEIEEYETDDDKEILDIPYIDARLYLNTGKVEVDVKHDNSLDGGTKEHKSNHYWGSGIYIERPIIRKNYNKDKLIKKYEKVMYDIKAEINSLKIQGWTRDMIEEWFNTESKKLSKEE